MSKVIRRSGDPKRDRQAEAAAKAQHDAQVAALPKPLPYRWVLHLAYREHYCSRCGIDRHLALEQEARDLGLPYSLSDGDSELLAHHESCKAWPERPPASDLNPPRPV